MQTSFCLGINIFVLFTGWWGSKEWVVCSFFSNNVALPWKHSSLDQTQGFPLVEASWRAELHTQNLPDGLYQTLHGVFPLWWITRLDRWNELLPNHRASESLPAVIVRQREDLTLASSSTAGLKLISLKGKKNNETPDIWTHVGAAACDSSREIITTPVSPVSLIALCFASQNVFREAPRSLRPTFLNGNRINFRDYGFCSRVWPLDIPAPPTPTPRCLPATHPAVSLANSSIPIRHLSKTQSVDLHLTCNHLPQSQSGV